MKINEIIKGLIEHFEIETGDYNDELDLQLVQIITSNKQAPIPNSLCIMYKNIQNFTSDDTCFYLVSKEYSDKVLLKNNYACYDEEQLLELILFLQKKSSFARM